MANYWSTSLFSEIVVTEQHMVRTMIRRATISYIKCDLSSSYSYSIQNLF
jgi:hypothetical protein